jgi:hypothetical protein
VFAGINYYTTNSIFDAPHEKPRETRVLMTENSAALSSRPDPPEGIDMPRRGLNDISGLSTSRRGRNLSFDRGVNLANTG